MKPGGRKYVRAGEREGEKQDSGNGIQREPRCTFFLGFPISRSHALPLSRYSIRGRPVSAPALIAGNPRRATILS